LASETAMITITAMTIATLLCFKSEDLPAGSYRLNLCFYGAHDKDAKKQYQQY
jgi:hypothetical protein